MPIYYADEFSEIPKALSSNDQLRAACLTLVEREPIAGKSTEGGHRLTTFRAILAALFAGDIDLQAAINRTEAQLGIASSPYAGNNRVFPKGWAERLVRTQYSRFYNQAILEHLIQTGQTQCRVPHSSAEDASSPCSLQLAGRNHDPKILHARLVRSYGEGDWAKEAKIPGHPHCTHVVAPAN